ncbi:glycosyltransferase family 2 protein [Evansella sp. AB-P1]|uniref:glycosyltransferase family 2 protein n=1 Tax=Evansella sp. AB-P1 TaxID=3037653 RepID=UPI00241D1364|nr:glycosyltransferase family 2 protein [Evansella sp. AB-P1]MDG5786702.1 glycosyltransferase family 2 protein [Evansella sp. AB-P1]
MDNRKNDNKPLISIITPAYNSERFIRDTVESVLRQTFTNWEMIIVDDYSSDQTIEIIKEYMEQDERIKLIQLERNSGPAVARNTAMEHARGRYFAFLDSDDQWLPEKLEKQLTFMEENDIAFSYTNYIKINERGEEVCSVGNIPPKVNYHQLLKENVIGCLTVMLDTEKTGKVKMVNIRSRQDYVLWLSICKKGHTAYCLQEVLSVYRVVENSLSSNKIKMAKQNWKVYREIEKLSLLKSTWYFLFYVYFKIKKYSVES